MNILVLQDNEHLQIIRTPLMYSWWPLSGVLGTA